MEYKRRVTPGMVWPSLIQHLIGGCVMSLFWAERISGDYASLYEDIHGNIYGFVDFHTGRASWIDEDGYVHEVQRRVSERLSEGISKSGRKDVDILTATIPREVGRRIVEANCQVPFPKDGEPKEQWQERCQRYPARVKV